MPLYWKQEALVTLVLINHGVTAVIQFDICLTENRVFSWTGFLLCILWTSYWSVPMVFQHSQFSQNCQHRYWRHYISLVLQMVWQIPKGGSLNARWNLFLCTNAMLGSKKRRSIRLLKRPIKIQSTTLVCPMPIYLLAQETTKYKVQQRLSTNKRIICTVVSFKIAQQFNN